MFDQSFAWLLMLLFFAFTLRFLSIQAVSPLRSVPGPLLARLTPLWEVYALVKHDFATYNSLLHEKFGWYRTTILCETLLTSEGPVVRLGPKRYSIRDAKGTKAVLHKLLDKSEFYYPFGDPLLRNVFSAASATTHHELRQQTSTLYSIAASLTYEPCVDSCITALFERLKHYAINRQEFEIRELMQHYAFDAIGQVTVSADFGLLRNAHDESGVITAIHQTITYGAIVGLVPKTHWWFGKLSGILRLEPPFTRITKFVTRHIEERRNSRTQPSHERHDFLAKLLKLELTNKISSEDTFNACLSNIVAGSDTIAIALSSVIIQLSMKQNDLDTLRRELDEAVEQGIMSDPPLFSEMRRLRYLDAVIREALRIHPVVGQPIVRCIGILGANIAGYDFPPGTEVGINPWVHDRSKVIFGDDATAFEPARWLTSNEKARKALEGCLTFGAGARICPGKNISLMELFKVVPYIVRHFDFILTPDEAKGTAYTWATAWFVKPTSRCRVKMRS